MNKSVQAKIIPDDVMLNIVQESKEGTSGAKRQDIIDYFKMVYPVKIVNAKLRACVRAGLLIGCADSACVHCSGNYSLTVKGAELLSRSRPQSTLRKR